MYTPPVAEIKIRYLSKYSHQARVVWKIFSEIRSHVPTRLAHKLFLEASRLLHLDGEISVCSDTEN
jgi:hypothetical protein